MHAVISLLLQSRKFWWYLLLTSSMILHDVIMTLYRCSDKQSVWNDFVFQQDIAPAHCDAHVQQLSCCVKKCQLSCVQHVASKQPRFQFCGSRDMGCHAVSCLPQIVWYVVVLRYWQWSKHQLAVISHFNNYVLHLHYIYRQIHCVNELKRWLIDVWCGLEQSTFDETIDQWRGIHRACPC